MRRGLITILAVLAAFLALPSAALARSSKVVAADVSLRLGKDASLIVSERLTFSYDGSFHASYRDIPLSTGESINTGQVTVSEGNGVYQPGGCTVQGCTDATGRYGVTQTPSGDGARIVWHHNASDERRTFTVIYRVMAPGHVIAYDDVIDVYWQVWGDQWDQSLPHLTANLEDPALDPNNPFYRVWGHPRNVEGKTVRGQGEATLEASDVPAHHPR